MNTFSNETCLNIIHQCFIFQGIVQIHFHSYPVYKLAFECLLQKKTMAADEQLIASPCLILVSAFSSLAQKMVITRAKSGLYGSFIAERVHSFVPHDAEHVSLVCLLYFCPSVCLSLCHISHSD